jgi:hypothetical protein
MTERELQRACVELLRRAGFVVKVFSQHRPTTRQVADFPDVIAFCENKTALIEFKAKGAKLRPGQEKFASLIAPFLGPNLGHFVIDDLSQLQAIIIMLTTDYSDPADLVKARGVMQDEDTELDVGRG